MSPLRIDDTILKLARCQIAWWAKLRDPSFTISKFHAHLAGELDRVISGETTRLIIQSPPQHGKSRLVAELCSAWLGHNPELPIITTSYSASLAIRNSRMVRAAVRDPLFRTVFGDLRVDAERSASNDWGLAGHGGGVIAAGVGGPVTGHGAGLGVVDDPVKNAEEAYSSTTRESIWQWWESTFLTRIWEGGRIVVIMTRWHPDDLVGRILDRSPDGWKVLNYPALAEDHLLTLPESARPRGVMRDSLGRQPGEPLATNRFSREHLEGLRDTLGSVVWSSLYQQRPVPIEGGILKVDKIEILDSPPPLDRTVRAWDFASTPEGAGSDPDYTAGVLIGQTTGGRFVILDVVHGRLSPAQAEAALVRTAEVDGRGVPIHMEIEPGSSGVSLHAHYARLLAGWSVWGERATGPQLLRVLPLAAQIEAGNVSAVRGPWLGAMLDEMRAYRGDGHTHDDVVVAAALGFSQLTGGVGLMAPPADDETKRGGQIPDLEGPWES
jgi:predicted phage terminase large subunit-like protein